MTLIISLATALIQIELLICKYMVLGFLLGDPDKERNLET